MFQQARAMIFDFDGTLVDSNAIKWKAFERCFEDVPEYLQEILRYCCTNNHVPRWEKFRYVHENILKIPYTAETESKLLKRFEEETTEQIIAAPAFPDAERFLQQASHTRLLGVLSSTPHPILSHILQHRGWTGYFTTLQGAPVDKGAWLEQFRKERGFSGREVFFFGDTPEDALAAEKSGCRFIPIVPLKNFSEFLEWTS